MNEKVLFLQGQLAQIHSRYSGKIPFGPLDDLTGLYESLDSEGKSVLIEMLRERGHDRFWGYFVKALFEKVGIRLNQ